MHSKRIAILLLGLLTIACGSFSSVSEIPMTATIKPTGTAIPPTRTPVFGDEPAETPEIVVNEPETTTDAATELPEYTPTATEAAPSQGVGAVPTQPARLEQDHYWFSRPIPDGYTDYFDRTYPYGGTSNGKYRPHTGVEFVNPVGTSILAAGDGVVYFAGEDTETQFGPSPGFYGNVIVLEHVGRSYEGQPVYTVYGHLSAIAVEQGATVTLGQVIGEVGGTGAAAGAPHLHFEVRVGDPLDYFASTRNPDLWISPYYGFGTLVGRVVDGDGVPQSNVSLTVVGEGYTRYTWTYAGAENQSDETWSENFTYGDLPEGLYTITTRSSTRAYTREIYIEAGQSNWLEIIFE